MSGETSARYAVNLHTAASNGDMKTVQAFIEEAPFDLNRGDQAFGWTPLHLAVKYEHVDVVLALVEAKAMLGLPDKRGMSPIEWAERKMMERKLGIPEVDTGSILMGPKDEHSGSRNVADICSSLFGYIKVGHSYYMEADRTAKGEPRVDDGVTRVPSVHSECEALRLARAHGNPQALKVLMLTAHEESAMHALQAKIKRLDYAAVPSQLALDCCTFLLQLACLNRRPFGETPGGAVTQTVALEVEMVDSSTPEPLVHRFSVPHDTLIAECLARAITHNTVGDDWQTEFDTHCLFLNDVALDILSPLEPHLGGATTMKMQCKASPAGNYKKVTDCADTRRNLLYADTSKDANDALAAASALNMAGLESEIEATRAKLPKLQTFEQSAAAKESGGNCGNCAAGAAECNIM